MTTRTTSVQEAIKVGQKRVLRPPRTIMAASIGWCILLLALDLSWWDLLLIPAGMLTAMLYEIRATSLWQIWAYDHVADIHQLQRSAELAGILNKGSHERVGVMISASQKEELTTLQERFLAEAVFVDDPSIPGRTPVFSTSSDSEPILALNSAGIWTEPEGFFDWDQITNERIPQVSYSRMKQWRPKGSPGSEYLFRFDHSGGCFEIPLSALTIEVWELDLLLYIYRGRYAMGQIPTSISISS